MTTTLADSISRFSADPSSGHVSPSVTASSVNGRARLSAGPFNWDSDLPPVVGGHNEAPSPTAYLLGALAGCAVSFISATLAPQFEVEIEQLSATASCSTDLAGLLGVQETDPRLHGITLDIHVVSPSAPERVQAMRDAWLQRCPVYLSLRDANSVAVSFT